MASRRDVLTTEDTLEKIALFASDPLRPRAACALAACSHDMRLVMRGPMEALRAGHEEAKALAAHVGESCESLQSVRRLEWNDAGLATAHARTLGALLGSGAMPLVEEADLDGNDLGDEGLVALAQGLGCGAAPRLGSLFLGYNLIGPDGAAALAAALARGALPMLEVLGLRYNRLGDRAVSALAPPLRRRASLRELHLCANQVGDDGVAALLGGLGKRELKALGHLGLHGNPVSNVGCAALISALDGGALPAIGCVDAGGSAAASDAAICAVHDAAAANQARRRA